MALKDWTTTVAKTHYGVEWPPRGADQVHKFLRENFGDNNIHQAYTERRWIVIRGVGVDKIYFRDEADAVWFALSWKLK